MCFVAMQLSFKVACSATETSWYIGFFFMKKAINYNTFQGAIHNHEEAVALPPPPPKKKKNEQVVVKMPLSPGVKAFSRDLTIPLVRARVLPVCDNGSKSTILY